ncbi:methionine--tRNA ligase [Viridibacillus sp. FSL R5-0477]|uniref:Methionine--tRNA ligase n=1 Tax=Viridibacillus arenosi FSL R5-213 TaxID=1227360 RepID=W4EXL1_9BACL|nr:methionine--tRNA ligase [Viridibacillus arenosi]ETT85275.1 methionyl-tRNA ligase [Viridibacillus arenosi FSL R5-213]OMC89338.1 methionine--tRNA ligase [Viridibacillus arenosi]
MSIVIGGAWPYANGSLHLGHIAALLPGDISARYYRLKKESVLYVSGSDCNGTPISIRANQEGVTVKEIADRYHEEFTACFKKLGFTYDLYTRTDAEHHHQSVKNIFLKLLDNGFLYKKTIEQTYCEHDKQFLPDRFVEGICPVCGSKARGDQCDYCSTILDPLDLIDRRCKICGNQPIVKETEHFYFAFSKMQNSLEQYVQNAKEQKAWRQNAIDLSERYLAEGVPDRAVTRDLPNGIDVPIDGFDGKKIYVWIEAVSGYYTATLEWAKQHQKNVQDFWSNDTISYYIHGKDNIPFHTIIWPAILMGLNSPALPTHIVSNEYLTLEKRKLSTSLNWAVWVPYIIEKYDVDTIRYFLTINAPENRDTDFSWREFIYSHNSELLGAYGNFVNRTLKFIEKSFNKQIPKGILNASIKLQTQKLYDEVAIAIEQGHFKAPLEEIFSYIRSANKYFDEQQPWLQVKDDEVGCANTLATCIYIIANLSQLLEPFIPFSTKKIRDMLGITDISWHELVELPTFIQYVEPLFERLDIALIDEEYQYLISQSNINK